MSNEDNYLISFGPESAAILSEEIKEKLAKKNLSASLVTALNEGCHAKWLADTFVLRDLVPEAMDNAATRGSMFHKVMEILFALPQEERTHQATRDAVDEVLNDDEFIDAVNEESIAWLRNAVNSYYSMGGKPEKVEIAHVKTGRKTKDGEEELKIGLEVFVKGKIGNTKRDILGFVDQVLQDPRPNRENCIVVSDWKSGAKFKEWNPKTKSLDGLPEARQQLIYTMLLENVGNKVSAAKLVYPVAKHIVNVNVNDENLRQRVIEDVEKADETLNELIESNEFSYNPTALCSWCPLVKICPKPFKLNKEKFIEAREKQHEPEALRVGIAF